MRQMLADFWCLDIWNLYELLCRLFSSFCKALGPLDDIQSSGLQSQDTSKICIENLNRRYLRQCRVTPAFGLEWSETKNLTLPCEGFDVIFPKVLWCWNRICSSGKRSLKKSGIHAYARKILLNEPCLKPWIRIRFIEWRDFEKYNRHLGPNKERFKLTEKEWTFRVEPGRNCYDQKWHCRKYNIYRLPEVIWSAEGKCKENNGGQPTNTCGQQTILHAASLYHILLSLSVAPQENQFLSTSRWFSYIQIM